MSTRFDNLSFDDDAPVIENINKSVSDNWERTKEINISGTENYCNEVNVEILDGDKSVYTGVATVVSNKWSITAVPEIEVDEIGKNLIVKVTDQCQNSTTQEFTVAKIDIVAPKVTSIDTITGEWTKTRKFTFSAIDNGVGNVSIGFNEQSDYKLANKDGNNYSREYNFVGDAYSPITAVVFYKDELGNTTSQEVTIDKIDNTAPTITGASFSNNKLNITANDEKEGLGEGSGVAKYRYITSTEKLENPSITEESGITVNKDDEIKIDNLSEVKYIYVVAEDAVGNVSEAYEVEVPTLTLKTSPNLEAANGHGGVNLDWSENYDPENKIFKVYQRKDDEENPEYESISTVDFYNEIEPIKVLNVYPTTGVKASFDQTPPSTVFTYSDGTTATLPKSALMKVWMEGGKIGDETFEGYAINPITGQKILDITPVSSTEFGNNPKMIWNYDIVAFGTWNGNGDYDDKQYDKGIDELEKYIKSGHGVLAGHDTIGNSHYGTGLSLLRKYFNIEVGYANGSSLSNKNLVDYNTWWEYGSTRVKVDKNGLITNFPYKLPIGSELTIPSNGIISQAAKGNVWMNFVEDPKDTYWNSSTISRYFDLGGTGDPTYYLTTYNNTAMIMIGHNLDGRTTVKSTEDERKVLANTLFYLAQLTQSTSSIDNSGQDLIAPDKPVISIKGNDGKIIVDYKSEKDNGSTYSYYVESFDDQDSSIKLAKSNERTETVTTGIKGYYYVIDDQETNDFELTRDENGNVTNATFTTDLSLALDESNHGRHIHIKAVDNAGNLSEVAETKLQKLILDTEVNLTAANGRGGVDLDWSSYDPTGKVFKAYQRRDDEEGSEFESISIVDFYDENETIEVLNVYPIASHIPTATFTYLDGTSETLPKSAALKVWMEGGTITENGNSTTFEAYGRNPTTNKQLLKIKSISSTEFDNKPEIIWDYDIVMFGSWDANGNYCLTDEVEKEIEKYIIAGRGILTGHDTMVAATNDSQYFAKLRKYFNIDLGYACGANTSNIKDVDLHVNWHYLSSYITVEKNGLLTNFPNKLPLGTRLEIPATHTNAQAAKGTVWMNIVDGEDNLEGFYNASGIGNPRFYLTTYNNTALIQTGHSNGESTDDERKILANTLFYLKQITKSTSFTDHSSQDVKAPNAPAIEFEGVKATNDIKLSYNSEDNGSEYSFYVQALDENDTTNVLDTSNICTEVVTTGVNGYYYVIDNNPDNYDFDTDTAEFTAENIANVDLSNNGKYFHVKAVDVAGNISDPTTVHIEVKGKVTIDLDGGELDKDKGPIEKEGLAGQKEDIGTPTKEGYTFKGWELPDGTIEEGPEITYPIGEEEIKAKWEVNSYKYIVSYYYNGEKDDSKTEELEADFNTVIETYTDKIEDGYKLEKVETVPLTIGTNEENNVINVYYIVDETKTKDITYRVEYYKNGEIVENDTEVVTETVQLLQPSTLTIDKAKANATDKYRGYALEKIQIDDKDVETLPETIETGKTIKIYYTSQVENLELRTEVNLNAANGHGGVDLDWTGYDPTDRVFRAFQKKEGSEEWESISTVDFYKEIEPIKVLNVYPIRGSSGVQTPQQVTFTFLDGNVQVLPKSASLKVWMEGGSNGTESFSAYGKNPITGQQIINVTPVSSDDFNSKPDMIWDFDIVVFGSWNVNGGINDQPNDKSLEELEKYIKAGYGILAGHDTMLNSGTSPQFGTLRKLRKYFNIEIGWTDARPADMSSTEYDTRWNYGSTKVEVKKDGILTNFPYQLPVGAKLQVPINDTMSQAACGNVWMTLVDGTDNRNGNGSINNYYNAGGKGDPKFYLTTWNNTAVIQTGPALCESTEDERKIFANTLFYLKQRTNTTAFTDNSSQDLEAPDKPSITVKGQDGKIAVNYKSEKDNGSTYSFKVEAYDDQRADIKLAESNERTETVTTGIKGYYYVIDDKETNDFDIATATYTEGLEGILDLEVTNHGKYIHVKAVDVAGNVSEVADAKLQKLILDTEVNLGAANGHGGVDLDWSTYDPEGKVFKAYQRKDDEEGSEFESISTVDLYETDLEPIKVLNVYPNTGNNLKTWMQKYGKNPKTGEQLIDVTPVSGTEFDANPEMIWNYDVLMFGSWDSNNFYTPNDRSVEEIEKYIKAGYGVLTGHDTVGYRYYDTGLSKLRKYFNIEVGHFNTSQQIDNLNKVDYNAQWSYASTQVIVNKNGLLTNFPYELPLGAKLTIPLTHTISNAAKGNVWMTLVNGTDNFYSYGSINSYYAAGGTGNPCYYLTTYNNTAMIQTGHSKGASTEDEQKIIANTLFYLKQITKSTSFTDHSSQDVKAPNAPAIEFEGVRATNDIKLSYSAEDNGSKYSFYVQALDENDTTNVIDTSNIRQETVTTGTEGYYYVIDEKPENYDFNIEDATYTTSSTTNVDLSNNGKYVHMKAVDVAGNISEPATVQIMIKVNQTLNLDGGTLNGEEGPIEIEVMPGVPTDIGTPEKEGYTFTGWEDPEGPIEGTEYTYPLDEVPITATWQVNQYDYTVRHFEKGTTTEIALAKTTKADFGSEILATDEATTIDGFTYDSADKDKLTITTNPANNTIDIYYTRVNGLSYTVNYLEKETNEVVYPAKTQGDQTFGKVINASSEVIDVEGYNYDSVDKETITITTSENVLNIYYYKKTDLSYTVKYLEKDTNAELATAKVVNNKEFKEEITEEAIEIKGYNKEDPVTAKLTISANESENEITFYYTKKNNLSYTVNYLEKDTNEVLEDAKVINDQVYGAEVTETAIDIIGYDKVNPTSVTISIDVEENVINFYYTKRNNLSYTVNYLEKDTNEILHEAKVVSNREFKESITEQAIDINGYDKLNPTSQIITIEVEGNEITFFYKKRNDLSYKVKYLEQGTNKELEETKVVGNKTYQDTVTEYAIDIDGYNKVDPDVATITIDTKENVITFYYTKRTDLSYTVRYLEQGSNNVLSEAKVVPNQVFDSSVTEKAIDITGYDKVEPSTQTITIGVNGNVITFYYTKRSDLSYTVKYLEQGTDKEITDAKVVRDQVFASTVIENAIDVKGYNKVEPTQENIVIGVGKNEIAFYYTKRNDLNYTVRYLDEDTEEEIADSKFIENQEYRARITENAISIEGYNLISNPDQTIVIDVEDNLIEFYYTKRTDLSYVVRYLEKDTDAELRSPKTVNGQTFNAEITENAIDIKGYNKVEPASNTITIGISGNEIKFYYTKRADLSYTVKYLEQGTKKVLADDKVVPNQVFGAEVTENAIDITGYNKVNPTTTKCTIDVEGNEIIFYYTKRNDLSYTVKYLEQGTEAEVADSKVVPAQVFEAEVTENAIDVEGYNKVEPTSSTITIGADKNEIIFYYTKRNDLTYTVKYLEEKTNKELATEKVVPDQVFGDEIEEAAIDITGYNKSEPSKTTIIIGVKENIITFYYTKRDNLSYTVKYLEQGTEAEVADSKIVPAQVFEAEVTENAIDVDGYNKVAPTSDTITIGVNTNEIKFYYTKRNDLSYTVNYLEKDTNKVLSKQKVAENQVFGTVINAKDEVIEINGYNYNSVDNDSITITTGKNEINVYYTKVTGLTYKVNYLDKDTNEVIKPAKVQGDQVFENVIKAEDERIEIDGYNYDSSDKLEITITTGENVLNLYYTKRNDLSYTVRYIEKDTNAKLADEKVVNNKTFNDEVTENAIDIIGYNKVAPASETITIATSENVITFYYTKRNDLSYTVRYLEQDADSDNTNNNVLAEAKVVNNQTYLAEVTEEAITIEGYDKVAPTSEKITIGVSGNEIIFYYTKRADLSYTVKYLEKDSDKELATTKVIGNQVFESKVTEEAITIEGYNQVAPTSETITIGVSGNEITFYYTKKADLSYTVKYLEKDNDEDNTNNVVLHEDKVIGNQVFESEVTEEAIDITGYDMVEPTSKTITIQVSGNEIIFYYTKRNDLSYTVKYLEKDNDEDDSNNTVLAEEKVVNGQTYLAEVTEEAIAIEGYNKVAPTSKTINIDVSGNEIVFYYTKRSDLSYTVKYLEKDTNSKLADDKVVSGQVFEAEVTEEAIDITGYDMVDPTSETITIGVSENEIIFYYTKRADLSYTVKYLEKDSDKELAEDKVVGGQTYLAEVTEEAIEISGYDMVEPTSETITIGVSGNEFTFYYTKRADLSYTVKYLEKDTNNKLADDKVVNGQVFESEVTEEAIEISGYDMVEPTSETITIGVSGNEIIFYYTKRADLSYTVRYLEKDTNKELATAKVVGGQTYLSEVTEEAIEISGYNMVEPTSGTITIGVSENEIVFYYTKRNNLSYTVKYLEKDSDKELATTKVIGDQVFESEVTEEAIEISGYDMVDPTSETITIGVSENEIIFYYTKRADLSYTVKYLEKDTNSKLADDKLVSGQVFESEVTENAIDIDGYNQVEPTSATIKIAVEGNEIVFFYTKKADLSYTVKYLEKDTNNKLAEEKVIGNQVFGSTVTESAIVIDGYNPVAPTSSTITIATKGNEIVFYYTKRNDLSYTVNYLEKDTNIVLKESKLVGGQTFGDVIETTEEKVAISGYDFDSIDKETITITTNVEANVINIFYVKGKFDYTVEYYYDNVIDSSKTETITATFQDVITTYEDKNIPGYKLQNVDKLPFTVTEYPVMNVIKVYYIKDIFDYSVNYYYDEVLNAEKTETLEAVFGTTIDTYEDKSEYGYELDRVENLPLEITKDPAQNVINVFYKRKDAQVIVHYVDKSTDKEIAEDLTKNGKVFDNFDVAGDAKEIEGYTLIEVPNPSTGRFEEEAQERTFYYAKNTKVIVKYLEQESNLPVAEDVIIEGYEGKDYTTSEQTVENYTYVDDSGELSGKMTRDEIIVIYYYLQNTKVVVNHIDQISGGILATESQEGLVGDKFSSSAKNFDGYVLVEKPEEETVTMAKDVITLNYYYKKVSAGVIEKHIDIKTNELLDSTLYEGIEGDEYKTKEKSFYGYDIVVDQMPENAEGTMTVEVIEVKYYYIRKASVKVEYIDKATGKTINETYQLEERDSTEYIRGYEGDPYKTVEKQFTGYDIIPQIYPANAEGVMQVVKDSNGNVVIDSSGNAVTETVVKYYYAYKTQVIEKYVDAKTGEVIEEIPHPGHEGDEYEIRPKEIPGYDIVEDKKPTNTKGKMTADIITVEYQYIKKMSVRVEYLDVMTNEVLTEKVQVPGRPGIYTDKDSTEIIKGHEGDEYKTKEKVFENYTIVKDKYPLNWQGTMELTENGTELVVRYYYVHVSRGVVEKHIDAITGKELESETRYNGNEGDPYKTSSKEFKGYDLVENRLPENAEGTMTLDEIVVKYYYIRKATVTVQYLEENTNNKLEPDKVIDLHEGEKYYTDKRDISGYEFVRTYGEKEGTLGKEDITIKYYYKKVQTPVTNTTPAPTVQQSPTKYLKDLPETGDVVPFVAGGVILLVAMANVIVSILKKKRNKN